MTDLIDEIIKLANELPKPEISRIIVVNHGIPETEAKQWKKHGGILWMHAKMLEQMLAALPPESADVRTLVTGFMGIRVEAYTPHVHGKLWLEFLQDCHHA